MYIFWGKVREGKKRGKKLGYPTLNVDLSKKIPEGIYASLTKINNRTFKSATFIGNVKTFNEKKYLSETYIIDFDEKIYNEWASIKLLKKIRNNQKFENINDLVDQIGKDIRKVREHFNM